MARFHIFQSDIKGIIMDYEKMVSALLEIDSHAAYYVEHDAKTLNSYQKNANSLDLLFTWADSPQGGEYWVDINIKMHAKLNQKQEEEKNVS